MSNRLRLLVADDDALTRQFFEHAATELGAQVQAVGDGDHALASLRSTRFDLVVLDLHMPGIEASALLDRCRSDPSIAHDLPPFVAVSGELDATRRDQLLRAGFAEAHQKPLGLDAFDAMLRRLCTRGSTRPAVSTEGHVPFGADASELPPLLDDAAALRALGSVAALIGMRGLFVREWPAQAAQLRAARARDDRAAIGAVAHRLRAACGFCGLPRLAAATVALGAAIERGERGDSRWIFFDDSADQTLALLQPQSAAAVGVNALQECSARPPR